MDYCDNAFRFLSVKRSCAFENELEIIELDESQLKNIQGGNPMLIAALKAFSLGVSSVSAAAKLGTWIGTSRFGNRYFFPKGLKIGNFTVVVPTVVTL